MGNNFYLKFYTVCKSSFKSGKRERAQYKMEKKIEKRGLKALLKQQLFLEFRDVLVGGVY